MSVGPAAWDAGADPSNDDAVDGADDAGGLLQATTTRATASTAAAPVMRVFTSLCLPFVGTPETSARLPAHDESRGVFGSFFRAGGGWG
jgi:hypothetical protein